MRCIPKQPKVVRINGIDIRLLTIGQLGLLISRSRRTILLWEQQGILPPPMFRMPGGSRRYTLEEANAIVRAFNEENVRNGVRIPETFIHRLKEDFGKIREMYRKSGLIV